MQILEITKKISELSIKSKKTLFYIKYKQENSKNLKSMIIIKKIKKISLNKMRIYDQKTFDKENYC